jgi:hypothetical protein
MKAPSCPEGPQTFRTSVGEAAEEETGAEEETARRNRKGKNNENRAIIYTFDLCDQSLLSDELPSSDPGAGTQTDQTRRDDVAGGSARAGAGDSR